jgi:hypothetical protein
MATQTLGTNHAALLPRQADVREDADLDTQKVEGSAIRGFFFAMIFNAMLVLTGAAGWELWRLMR